VARSTLCARSFITDSELAICSRLNCCVGDVTLIKLSHIKSGRQPSCQPASFGKVESLKRDEADMATNELTSDEFVFLNPPIFCGLHTFRIETPTHPNGEFFRFAQFQWNGQDYWFLPRESWYDRLDCGLVYVCLRGGRRRYSSTLLVRPASNRWEIPAPEFRKQPKGRIMSILEFPVKHAVDISFLKHEDKRLWARKPTHSRQELTKIARPPKGHVV
jgi:hypothetical protein